MDKIFTFLEKYVMEPLAKVSQLRFVRAIMAAGVASIPLTIVGSLFLVLTILPLTFPGLESFFDATFFRFSDLYMLAHKCTVGLLALYFSAVIGYEYTRIVATEDEVAVSPINGALLSVFAFFLCVPELLFKSGNMVLIEAENVIGGWRVGGSGLDRIGTSGIFTAIIMGVISARLYSLCVRKNWVIKMPDSVPAGVARSFTALIPTFVITIVVLFLNAILIMLGTDIFKVIEVAFKFVTNLTDSWLGICIIYFLTHALWIVGIHGANIIFSFLAPILLANMEANYLGANIPFAGEFSNSYAVMGGSGATLGLTIFLVFFAKSGQLKILGKASIAPALFNINEPLIFGIPIVYNPSLAIPFFLAPMTTASLAYFATKWELVKPIIAQVPWPSPVGVGAFIGTAGDYKAVILALICAVIAFLIYLPFIKVYDSNLFKEEQGQN